MPKTITNEVIDEMVNLHLAGRSPKQIADELHLTDKTIRKYIYQNPEFASKLEAARVKVRKALIDKTVKAGDYALGTLIEICADPDASHANKIQAAGKILDFLKTVPLLQPTEDTEDKEFDAKTLNPEERNELRNLIKKCSTLKN